MITKTQSLSVELGLCGRSKSVCAYSMRRGWPTQRSSAKYTNLNRKSKKPSNTIKSASVNLKTNTNSESTLVRLKMV